MDMKFSLSVAGSSISFEGDTVSFEEKVEPICEKLLQLVDRAAASKLLPMASAPIVINAPIAAGSEPVRDGTINVVISKFGGASCMDVMKAAAIHLSLFEGIERFTDNQWEDTARGANTWKSVWSSQKANAKKRLISSGYIIENASGIYSLSPASRSEAVAKLDN
jgi:hypothetical protein